MNKIYITGKPIVVIKAKYAPISGLVVSRRLYRFLLIKSLKGKRKNILQSVDMLETEHFVFPLFCVDTGLFVGYKKFRGEE